MADINTHQVAKPERLFSPDLIRLLSFLSVVLFHFNMEIFQNYPNAMRIGSLSYAGQSMGDIGISMFIIISGLSLSFSGQKNFSIGSFFKKRFLAIYPSFWIAYIIVGVVYFLVNGHFVGDGHHWKILLSVIGLDGFFLYKMQNYYLVGEWYTGYMLITYLAFPLLFYGCKKNLLVTWLLVMIVFFVVGINYHSLFKVYINCNPLMRLPDFLYGITYCMFILHSKQRRLIMLICGIIVMAIIIPLNNFIMPQLYMFLFGAAFFSIAACVGELIKNVIICKGVISYLAKYSFVAFLFHHQILYMLFNIINYPILTRAESFFLLFIIVLFSFCAAIITEPLVNKFTDFLRKKIM